MYILLECKVLICDVKVFQFFFIFISIFIVNLLSNCQYEMKTLLFEKRKRMEPFCGKIIDLLGLHEVCLNGLFCLCYWNLIQAI